VLNDITPLILTYNEAPNIGRSLERLTWARDIVVIDSFSNDDTLEIVSRFPQARVFQRKFDSLENQWNFGLKETGIKSGWILALDADYIVTPELLDEIKSLQPVGDVAGYRTDFRYCVYGRALRGSAYPAVTVLFRPECASYRQDGHAHRVVVTGQVESLGAKMLHDDRKSLSRWLNSQDLYQQLEFEKLTSPDAGKPSFADRIRRMRFISPFVVFFYCLVAKRGILDGKSGIYYAFQRMLAETLLALRLLDAQLTQESSKEDQSSLKSHIAKPSQIQ
jgi:glycosyltransferase involved in cell wall biosynthesis